MNLTNFSYDNNNLVRVRFAPSPTGDLHIGGARTALFNYIWAKKNKGQLIFRVEDTDLKRSKKQFIINQYEDLCWLGLKPDESLFEGGKYGPYLQSERIDIYWSYVKKLLVENKAYYCFCSSEDLANEKQEYIQKNKSANYQYSRKCLSLTTEEIQANLHCDKKYVIRFLVNQNKTYQFNDLVRGLVVFRGQDIEDFVLYRSNLIPLFNLAVVIDDYLMNITHVIRGEEHLSNTIKHLLLYETFGWKPPVFIHISTILNEEGKKLSKRDQNNNEYQSIRQLRKLGYLSSAIVNYLLLLGWHPGSKQEFFSLSEAVTQFNLENLHSSGAIYSLKKLNWYNNHYIQQLSLVEFNNHSFHFLNNSYNNLKVEQKDWVGQIAALFRSQLNNFCELINLSSFFFTEPEVLVKKSEFIILKQELLKINWDENNIIETLKLVNNKNGLSKKDFYLSVRNKITGQNKGPELHKIIFLLGKDKTISRLLS